MPDRRAIQSGIALVVVLILLGALLALALSAIQASALETVMTGNESYRARALAAAEAGLAQATAALVASGGTGVPEPAADVSMPGDDADTYQYDVADLGDDARLAELSEGRQLGHHYTVSAAGHSLRGATVHAEAGLLTVIDSGTGDLLAVRRTFWRRSDLD
jgi:type II secretory pathway pseudopilin PulG